VNPHRDIALIVIAKEPVPGRCKTRLCPPLRSFEAAGLARAAIADTLEAVARTPAARRFIALDGRPGPWLPAGFEVIDQGAGGLDRRLATAFQAVGGPALLVGMDTPQLSPETLERAMSALAADGIDAVLGPAPDGGYWAIGLRSPRRDAFEGVPMSSERTAFFQRSRLRELGMVTAELESMRDFDTLADAEEVAALCPHSRFARELATLRPAVAV
jgi:rSAM/selenodomain-associated transferase 1